MIGKTTTSFFVISLLLVWDMSARENIRGCHFSIELPAGSTLVATEKSSCIQQITLPPEKAVGLPGGAITIEPDAASSLEEICDRFQICKQADGHWWMTGRAGARDRARSYSSRGLRYVIGLTEVGRYEPGYQGSAKAPVAVIAGRSGRIALLTGDIDLEDDPRFEQVVTSFRFTK